MILSAAEQQQLVVDHLPFAKMIAGRVFARVPAWSVPLDDLVQEASLGLMDSASRYDPDKVSEGRDFKSFAYPRILGTVMDRLRACDRMTRDYRKLKNRVDAAKNALRVNGIEPTQAKLAAALGMSLERFHEVELGIISGNESDGDIENFHHLSTPSVDFSALERIRLLHDAIDRLEPRLRTIILAYLEGWLLRDIAQQLGVTESRICQLLKQAVLILSAKLG